MPPWITKENLLDGIGNSTQCSVVTKWEGNPKKRGYMYTQLIHFAVYQKLAQNFRAAILQ